MIVERGLFKANYLGPKNLIHERNKGHVSTGPLFSCVVLVVLAFSAGRYGVGWDFWAYYDTIVYYRDTNIMMRGEMLTIHLIKLAQSMNNPQLYFVINSAICVILLVITIKRYICNAWLSLILFVCFPLFYLNSFSVIRNFTAIAIVFYGTKYIYDQRFIGYVCSVLVAALFHKSALVALPFYFLRDIHLNRLFTATLLVVVPRLNNILNRLVQLYFPQYIVYTSVSDSVAGTKAIYALLAIAVIFVVFQKFIFRRNPDIDLPWNLFLTGILIYLTFMRQGVMGHRLSLYGTIQSVLVVPEVVSIFTPRQRVLIEMAIYALCLMMFFYTVSIGAMTYIPYRFFLFHNN